MNPRYVSDGRQEASGDIERFEWVARRNFSMSNPFAIRTASTSRFTLSTFTLRTDAVNYFSPDGDLQ